MNIKEDNPSKGHISLKISFKDFLRSRNPPKTSV